MQDVTVSIDADYSQAQRKFDDAQAHGENAARTSAQRIAEVWEKSIHGAAGAISGLTAGIIAVAHTAQAGFGVAGSAASSFTALMLKGVATAEALAGSYVFLTAALAKYGAAATASGDATAGLINGFRILRIAASAALPETFGSVAFASTTVAIGVLVEETGRLINARAKLIDQQALLSARTGLSIGTVERTQSISQITGGKPEDIRTLYSAANSQVSGNQGAVQSALRDLGVSKGFGKGDVADPELLRQIAQGFSSIEDPVKRASAAVAIFGQENAGTALQELTPEFVNAANAANKFGLGLDATSRTQISAFRQDLLSIKRFFTDFSEVKAWGQHVEETFVAAGAAAYDMIKRGLVAFDELTQKLPGAQELRQLSNGPTDQQLKDKARELLSADAQSKEAVQRRLQGDALIAEARGEQSRRDATLEGLKGQAERQASVRNDLLKKLTDDDRARQINPNSPKLLSSEERFNFAIQQRQASQNASVLGRTVKGMEDAEEARKAAADARKEAADAAKARSRDDRARAFEDVLAARKELFQARTVEREIFEEEGRKAINRPGTIPNRYQFAGLEGLAYARVDRQVQGNIEGRRYRVDRSEDGNVRLRDLSGTAEFQRFKATQQQLGNQLFTNELQKLVSQQSEIDERYYKERTDRDVKAFEEAGKRKLAASYELDRLIEDQYAQQRDRHFEIDTSQLSRDRDLQLQQIGAVEAQTVAAKLAVEDRKLQIEKDFAEKSNDIAVRKLELQRDLEIGVLQRKAAEAHGFNTEDVGFKEDVARIRQVVGGNYKQQIDAARKATADKELIDTKSTTESKAKIILDANRALFDNLKSSANGLFDALISHSKTAAQIAGDFFKTAILTPLKEIASSQIAGLIFRSVTGQGVSFGGHDQGTGRLGAFGGILGALGLNRQPVFHAEGANGFDFVPSFNGTRLFRQRQGSGLSSARSAGMEYLDQQFSPSGIPEFSMTPGLFKDALGEGKDTDAETLRYSDVKNLAKQNGGVFSDLLKSMGKYAGPVTVYRSDRAKDPATQDHERLHVGQLLATGGNEKPFSDAEFAKVFGFQKDSIDTYKKLYGEKTYQLEAPAYMFEKSEGAASATQFSRYYDAMKAKFPDTAHHLLENAPREFQQQYAPVIQPVVPDALRRVSPDFTNSDLPLSGAGGYRSNEALYNNLGDVVTQGNAASGLGRNPITGVLKQALGSFAGGALLHGGIKAAFGRFSSDVLGGAFHPGNTVGLAQNLSQLGHSNLALLGGGALAYDGLRRGGIGGAVEDTAGGALIGFKFGGPIGAAIGAGIGALTGLVRAFIPTNREHIKQIVKDTYRITISNQIADQIADIAKQNFRGQDSVAIRSQQVQELLSLYAQATGQNFPILVRPHDFVGAIQNGQLYQVGSSLNGRSAGFNSTLPTIAGTSFSQILPVGYGSGLGTTGSASGPANISIQLDGQATTQVLTGQIANSPLQVSQANQRALSSSNGRLRNQGNTLSPSTVF